MDVEILHNVVCPVKDHITTLIEKHAKRDAKSKISQEVARARVYYPYNHDLSEFNPYIDWLHTLSLSEKRCDPERIWGLTYAGEDYTHPHHHEGYRITGIHYMRAEEGCGLLQFNDDVIEPKEDMIVLAPGWKRHAVLPAEDPKARRTCVVFDLL